MVSAGLAAAAGPRGRLATAFAISGVLFGGLAALSMLFSREAGDVAYVWPANGVLLAFVLLARPEHRRPALAGAFVGNLAAGLALGDPLALAAILSAANITECLVAAGLLLRKGRPAPDLTRPSELLRFGVIAGLIAPTASAVVAVSGLAVLRDAPVLTTWLHWHAADALGLFIVTPALLVMRSSDAWPRLPSSNLKRVTLAAALAATLAVVFAQSSYPLLFLVPPVLMLIAFQCGVGPAALSILLTAAVSIAAAIQGSGPVMLMEGSAEARAFLQQLFLAVLVCMVLPLSAALAERNRLEQRLAEARDAAEAATRAKSNFLANMSHELRTPLTGIVGFTEVLAARATLSQADRLLVDRIRTGSEALMSVINDILEYSRLEADAVTIEARPFDPRELLDSSVSLLRAAAEAKQLGLSLEIGEGLPEALHGDPDRLRQVLLNLAGNAVKFTSAGGVRVLASYGAEEGLLRVEVRDTGAGIAADKLSGLFQRFVQEDGSVTRRFGGAGLGLAISKRLVELMGGRIGVESEKGQGSTFWFEAPMPPADPLASAARVGDGDESDPPSAARVLIVDDAEANRMLLSLILRECGALPHAVGDGLAALEAVQQDLYDLVLMDLHMPEMDGFEAVRRIRSLGASYGRLPIIALTADALSDREAECIAAGFDQVLTKPIKPPALISAIGARLRERAA